MLFLVERWLKCYTFRKVINTNIIEIGESLEYVAKRYLKQGMTVEETAGKTQLPLAQVEELAKA